MNSEFKCKSSKVKKIVSSIEVSMQHFLVKSKVTITKHAMTQTVLKKRIVCVPRCFFLRLD